jgi:hypothetical protein
MKSGVAIPDIPKVFLVEDVRRVKGAYILRIRNMVTPNRIRCARLRESDNSGTGEDE